VTIVIIIAIIIIIIISAVAELLVRISRKHWFSLVGLPILFVTALFGSSRDIPIVDLVATGVDHGGDKSPQNSERWGLSLPDFVMLQNFKRQITCITM